ncbi:MAG TPA: hypothetical protein VK013_00505 [Myxococcaceae bacterium]|nr:hypothetical protein [Myxococcaceae bacterium]
MHPLFARFMQLEPSRQALLRREAEVGPDAEEALWLSVADAFPAARDAVADADPEDPDDPDLVEPLILLAAHASLRALENDPRVSGPLQDAVAALLAEGATEEQARTLVASLILEEAFDEDQPAERFDADFIATSLVEVPALAALTPESVQSLRDDFVGRPGDPIRKAAFDALTGAAWDEGPQFIHGEHLEAAYDEGRRRLNKDQRPGLQSALEALLEHLAKAQLLSARRHQRLRDRLATFA